MTSYDEDKMKELVELEMFRTANLSSVTRVVLGVMCTVASTFGIFVSGVCVMTMFALLVMAPMIAIAGIIPSLVVAVGHGGVGVLSFIFSYRIFRKQGISRREAIFFLVCIVLVLLNYLVLMPFYRSL